jgi:hypothetical protein
MIFCKLLDFLENKTKPVPAYIGLLLGFGRYGRRWRYNAGALNRTQ